MGPNLQSLIEQHIDEIPAEWHAQIVAFVSVMPKESQAAFIAESGNFLAAFKRDDYDSFKESMGRIGYGEYAAMIYGILEQKRAELSGASPAV